MYDIIIIGAGPSGLTASIYARRALKKVLVLEANSYGGQIINSLEIENYPSIKKISGFDFATNLYNQALDLGVLFKFERVVGIDTLNKTVITNNNKYITKAIILAIGTENRTLNIDREKELIGHGISYCATCDGHFFKKQDVCVVGGGNKATEEALYLSDICNKVYLVHRRDTLKADNILIDKLKNKKNIKIIYNATINKLIGKDNLEAIEIKENSKIKKIKVKALFVAIGHVSLIDNFKDTINFDDDGYCITNELCHTNIPFIFASGDIRKKELRQLVTATSDGAIAANEAIKYINNL